MILLACDMGGTRMKAAVVSDGRIAAQAAIPARSDRPMRECLASLAAAFRKLAGEAGVRPADCAGICLSFPSLVDNASGRVLAEYGKYRDAPGTDLRAWARAEFGLPLAIENDARMALVGEWRHGAGRGHDDLVMITLGTGLGVAALLEGRLIRGRHGQAAVLGGHTTVRPGGRRCTCGNVGCAETEAATSHLREIAAEQPGFAASALRAEPELDFAAVFRLARKGDACARAIAEHSTGVWATLAVNMIHTFDPERVILGGGIMAAADQILPAVRDHVARHAHTPWGRVDVVPAELGDGAALMAAEWLMEEHLRLPR